jgi:hypothetical protein
MECNPFCLTFGLAGTEQLCLKGAPFTIRPKTLFDAINRHDLSSAGVDATRSPAIPFMVETN